MPAVPAAAQTNDGSATECPGPYCVCGATVTGKVVFTADLQCIDEDGLKVGASGTTIDLNGFRLQCNTLLADVNGFHQSCQGALNVLGELDTDPDPEIGIDQQGFSNVVIRGSGSILGFDTGIWIQGPAKNVDVNKVNVSGPDAVGGFFAALGTDRPNTKGIHVQQISCPTPGVRIRRNSVDNHVDGVFLDRANCTDIDGNFIHDNNPGSSDFSPGTSHAIHVSNSSFNRIFNNLVVDNGINVGDDAGIVLDAANGGTTTGNRVANNNVSYNNGYGILAIGGASGNRISNNTLALNTSTEPGTPTDTDLTNQRVFFDLANTGSGANTWEANNRCETELAPGVPENVCNPGETTDPLK